MVKITKKLYVTNRDDWRTWLENNHETENEIWLIYYKKHTGKPTIRYDEAVEEALCYGWIDSIVKRIDDEKYTQKYTPRKDKSIWSELNKKRVKKLIKQGRMTEVGLAKINAAKKTGEWQRTTENKKGPAVPAELKKALAANKKAEKYFSNLAPSYKKQYIGWIESAKRDETRIKRIKETVKILAQNKKLGMK